MPGGCRSKEPGAIQIRREADGETMPLSSASYPSVSKSIQSDAIACAILRVSVPIASPHQKFTLASRPFPIRICKVGHARIAEDAGASTAQVGGWLRLQEIGNHVACLVDAA